MTRMMMTTIVCVMVVMLMMMAPMTVTKMNWMMTTARTQMTPVMTSLVMTFSDDDDDSSDDFPCNMPTSDDDDDNSTDTTGSKADERSRPDGVPEDDTDNGLDNVEEPRSMGSTLTDNTNDTNDNRYNLRSSRDRPYSHCFDHQMDKPESSQSYEAGIQLFQDAVETIAESPTDVYKYIYGPVITQMSAMAGIKKHGQPAIDALLAEFGQLDDKNIFKPCDALVLSKEQKKQALRAINLIKEKHCGRLKGCMCADR